MGFDAVLLEARILTELMRAVLEHLVQPHAQGVPALGVGDVPLLDPVAVGVGLDLGIVPARGAQRARRLIQFRGGL